MGTGPAAGCRERNGLPVEGVGWCTKPRDAKDPPAGRFMDEDLTNVPGSPRKGLGFPVFSQANREIK